MNPAAADGGALGWLWPLAGLLDQDHRAAWRRLEVFAEDLDTALARFPVGPEVTGQERSRRLLAVRHEVQRAEYDDQPPLFQLFAQFVCGYRDLDLRDSSGLGHGALIARHGSARARLTWVPRLHAGELAGIAITEPHGGSRPAATRTRADVGPNGTWRVTGQKTWISRLGEAAVFVVFFRDPEGKLTAAAIDATRSGLQRTQLQPNGLAGWSWGVLDLDAVEVQPEEVLGGDGMSLLRGHFAGYRPLVTATALGAAAAVFDTVTDTLAARRAGGGLARLRDSALVTIGRAHARLSTALCGAAIAVALAADRHDDAEWWGAATKAHGVDTADATTAELALLVGAAGFQAGSSIAKTRRDLGGLLYADGIHDSLYRAAGKHHTTTTTAVVPAPAAPGRTAVTAVPLTA